MKTTYEEFIEARKSLKKTDYAEDEHLEAAEAASSQVRDAVLMFMAGSYKPEYAAVIWQIIDGLNDLDAKLEALCAQYRSDNPVLFPPRESEDREWMDFCASLRGE